jgi:hypothetical protein
VILRVRFATARSRTRDADDGRPCFALAGLYARCIDVWDAVDVFVDVMDAGTWKRTRMAVT